MHFPRSSGILLHPTSLPGRFGIGDLGPEAIGLLDFLAASGQTLWQVLPLNPPGYSNSPYQCYSAFAGNPLLISPELLVRAGLLTEKLLADAPVFPAGTVDFEAVARFKNDLLRTAHRGWKPDRDYETFTAASASWLEDYALFTALSESREGRPWNEWEPGLALRDPKALKKAAEELKEEVDYHRFVQYIFHRQHDELKREAAKRGIRLIGDIPIFVAHNSADVWAGRELFHLDAEGAPTYVAGVPPDYFSETGQRWGNPLYRWEVMARDGYAWWIERLRTALTLYDIVRIDHFRGFEAYWQIPAAEKTAINGRWVPGPGAGFFRAVRSALGTAPILAEDLGVITPKVEALRDRFELPGMKIIQFAFSAPDNVYLPHNYGSPNCIVYTGTHDNDTTCGWWAGLTKRDRAFIQAYIGRRPVDISWEMMRIAFGSIACMAVVPMQDLLSLGSEARMNTPGTTGTNWGWRMSSGMLTEALRAKLWELTAVYGRLGEGK